ncbi:7-carboxy-7-deazaguanine synthase QueE [Aggregatibacter actinomycetemcomitans]|uniref:7-carboxy-7-deazaguanine synthase n=3 Tax=Aggregatibacter actinomycetemcomitans TaxID=714 RepID=A0A142FYE7_AGGAC|nr:7-carboxy-7-deazaguanine synthase QueE [Aggregatibacter actinomycetemcomitans]AMQ93427.1 radical SAM protein [Aggregatibacter actinomycetemcomitans]ANU82706.1 radical SAM protein [Aggregatibacter actinomycetemcomitans]KND85184.1 radical SAM protein [Aggregatibacter actinomycetemcomitans serotype a str. H5P1]KOE30572.1 radical SAM protein [Aggregatibacter actinomycetemcomitans D17P-3]KOE62884.1 radical SAM protein [Aggregatibacter actinomycetemcomitans serotype e str. A160]
MQNSSVFMPSYNIVEIFESLQGEGFNTGMPCIFVRFGKCNLTCPWCDTNYNQFERMTLAQVMEEVRSFSSKNIIITGGEPTIVPNIEILLEQMKSEGYFLAIETNGLKPIPPQIDYIATSPKRLYPNKYERRCIDFAHEVRIVADENVMAFCELIEDKIRAERYYLSPCEINGKMNLLETITQLGQLNQRVNRPKWLLSVQTHKLIGIE